MHGLSERDRQPELMDNPSIDSASHVTALRGLRRVNRLSRTAQGLWRVIADGIAPNPQRPVKILDVACGGGDVAIDLARTVRNAGQLVKVVGCDISATAIDYARRNATSHESDVQFELRDALADGLPSGFDVVYCTLFLHHLDDDDAEQLLRNMAGAACQMVVVSDLRRTVTGYLLAWIVTRLLSRSVVVHTDGPLSVRAAFSVREMRDLCNRSGLQTASVVHVWPQRMLMTWCPTTS